MNRHNSSYTTEYRTWTHMKSRCTNKKVPEYKHYGGRGIKICNSWFNSFENFIRDLGKKPTSKHSLDRIDVNGNYCKENCRWATWKEQNSNRRDNVKYKNKLASHVSKELGGTKGLVNSRMRKGWSKKIAFTKPKRQVLKYKGETVLEACNRLKLNRIAIYIRLRRGWSIKRAFNTRFLT